MLVPALRYKDEILKKFASEMYSQKYFYYMGYACGHELPKIDDSDNNFRWAIVDENETILGYLAYRINLDWSSVTSFGWYAFDLDEAYPLGTRAAKTLTDTHNKMLELFENFHRVSWCMVGGNKVESEYDRILKEATDSGYTTYKSVLHDCCKDEFGNYYDSVTYEVINSNK